MRQDEADRIDNQIDVFGQDVSGADGQLRPLPRPQVRRDLDEGLLRPGRLPAKLALSAGLHRSARADWPAGRRACKRFATSVSELATEFAALERARSAGRGWPNDAVARRHVGRAVGRSTCATPRSRSVDDVLHAWAVLIAAAG